MALSPGIVASTVAIPVHRIPWGPCLQELGHNPLVPSASSEHQQAFPLLVLHVRHVMACSI